MKKILSRILLLVVIMAGGLYAESDWGVKAENLTRYDSDEESLTQADRAHLWGKVEISENLRLYGEGGYLFRYEEEEANHLPEFSALYLNGRTGKEGGLEYTAGRFRLKDDSGEILHSLADGVRIFYPGKAFQVSFGTGYSGLVFIDSSEINLTPADDYERSDDDGFWAAPRLLQVLNCRYSDLPGGASLILSLVGQEDFRTDRFIDKYVPGTGKLHSQYLLLGADGRIRPDLFFTVSGTLQTGQYLIPDSDTYYLVAGAGKGLLEYYPDLAIQPKVSLELFYATGDKWADRKDWKGYDLGENNLLAGFAPISSSRRGYVFSIQPGNLMYGDLGFSIKPLENLQLALNGTTFFRAVNGPVSDSGVLETSGDGLYLGEEIDFTLNWRPFSDLGLSLSSGVFLPYGGILEEEDPQFSIGSYVSFSL